VGGGETRRHELAERVVKHLEGSGFELDESADAQEAPVRYQQTLGE